MKRFTVALAVTAVASCMLSPFLGIHAGPSLPSRGNLRDIRAEIKEFVLQGMTDYGAIERGDFDREFIDNRAKELGLVISRLQERRFEYQNNWCAKYMVTKLTQAQNTMYQRKDWTGFKKDYPIRGADDGKTAARNLVYRLVGVLATGIGSVDGSSLQLQRFGNWLSYWNPRNKSDKNSCPDPWLLLAEAQREKWIKPTRTKQSRSSQVPANGGGSPLPTESNPYVPPPPPYTHTPNQVRF